MSCATVSFTGGGLKFWIEGYSTTTQNTVSFTPKVTATNVNAAIVPKGTGAIVASIPNGLASGGNARGTYAVDFQMVRSAATQVAGGANSFVGAGQNNTIQSGSSNSAIVAGSGNVMGSYHSFIGGGTNNSSNTVNNSAWHVICGGNNNRTNGGAGHNYVSILGGDNNNASGTHSTIGGGSTNATTVFLAGVFAGSGNTSSNSAAFIGGGSSNTASGERSVIVGGLSNTASGSHSSVGGGQTNTASATHTTVGGGNGNTAGSSYDVVCGGQSNGTGGSDNSTWKFIGGGSNNTVSGSQTSYSGVACGNANQITSGRFAFIGGGRSNLANSGAWDCTIGGGQSNYANGNNQAATHATIGGGFTNTTSAFGAIVTGGAYGVANLYCQQVHASGRFSADGDAQAHELIWRRAITGTAQTELFLDGASIRAILPGTNSVWKGIINFAAVCTVQGTGTTGVGSVAAIDYSVTIKRIGTSTVLIGVNNLSPLDSDGGMGTSTFDISADDTNEALAIKFTPPGTAAADTVIRVVATFRGTQIKY
jgi:hypothetical protein